MLRGFVILLFVLFALPLAARTPIYVVDGELRESIDGIPHSQIASLTELEVSEDLIGKWGTEASNGVIMVELKWDTQPRLNGAGSLYDYLVQSVKWTSGDGVAKLSFRYRVSEEGSFELTEILEATSSRLRRRAVASLERIPSWSPALKAEQAVEWEGVLNLTLPLGETLPQERYLISR